MNGKMTAAVLYGKEDVKIEKVPIPHVEEGEVLIKVQVALTCGTDVKVYRRGYHARMRCYSIAPSSGCFISHACKSGRMRKEAISNWS